MRLPRIEIRDKDGKEVSVKALRLRLGMTQVEMARELGVDPVAISRWEREVTQPSKLAQRQLNRLVNRSRKA